MQKRAVEEHLDMGIRHPQELLYPVAKVSNKNLPRFRR